MRFILLLVILVVIGAGVVEWANAAWDAPGLPAPSGKETVVLIPPHSRTHDIAQMLEGKGVMKFGLLFELRSAPARPGRQDQGGRICHSVRSLDGGHRQDPGGRASPSSTS